MKKKTKSKKMSKKVATVDRDNNEVSSGDDDALVDGDTDGQTKKRRAAIDYEEFTRTWTSSDSVTEVAEALDIKAVSATAIASRLRKQGVELKRFARRSAQPVDVKALNKIAKGG